MWGLILQKRSERYSNLYVTTQLVSRRLKILTQNTSLTVFFFPSVILSGLKITWYFSLPKAVPNTDSSHLINVWFFSSWKSYLYPSAPFSLSCFCLSATIVPIKATSLSFTVIDRHFPFSSWCIRTGDLFSSVLPGPSLFPLMVRFPSAVSSSASVNEFWILVCLSGLFS